MIKYGLISEVDARCLEKTIDLILEELKNEVINITEIGLFDGGTTTGVIEYLMSKDMPRYNINYTGIDSEKDKSCQPIERLYDELIIGNSNEVYNRIEDNSQHLIFQDACHCFAHVVSDFFCYAPKVKVGGYLAFHDTGKHIKPFKDFQHGDKENPDAYISVRKALYTLGKFVNIENPLSSISWEVIFDEADPENEAGGICVFKKLY